MEKQIIRIDKGDGTESIESREDFITRVIRKRNRSVMAREGELKRFESGEISRIETSFAIYELREVA